MHKCNYFKIGMIRRRPHYANTCVKVVVFLTCELSLKETSYKIILEFENMHTCQMQSILHDLEIKHECTRFLF